MEKSLKQAITIIESLIAGNIFDVVTDKWEIRVTPQPEALDAAREFLKKVKKGNI